MENSILSFAPDAPWLAPLAGFSDLAFRRLCREHGAAVCCTEMVSVKGLLYGSSGTRDLLDTCPEDSPLVVQLFGNEAELMPQVMEPLQERGFRYFDLNMGCSVAKVNRTGCGAAMLKDIPGALKVAEVMIRCAGAGHVGFKFRLGWDASSEVWRDLARALQDLGAGWLCLHPRYARQGFSGVAQWSALEELAGLISIPLIASGDLFTPEDGVRCIRETGVNTVMYARGAMQNPAVFEEHVRLWQGKALENNLDQYKAALYHRVMRHAELARQHGTERSALLRMRTLIPRYAHHLEGVKQMRQHVVQCRSWPELEAILRDFLGSTRQIQTPDNSQPPRYYHRPHCVAEH